MENILLSFMDYDTKQLRSFIEYNIAEIEFVVDWSNYNYVDGEEGDYGVCKLSTQEGVHIADWVNEGGDTDYYQYTPEGLEYVKAKFKEAVALWLDKI